MLLEVQVSTVSDDLGCHVICWCWSTVFSEITVNAVIYQEILEHFMLPSADKLYGDADFIFQQDWHLPTLPKVPKAGSMTMCYCALLASKLPWPEPNREYMGYCQEEDESHQTQQCRWPEGKATWASITPEQCHRLIVSCHATLMQ